MAFEPRLKRGLTLLRGVPLDLHVGIAEAVLDGLNHPADVLLQTVQLPLGGDAAGAVLRAQPVHLARELVAELLEQVLPQQLVFQRREDARFYLLALDRQPVGARGLIARAEARKAVTGAEDESRAAHTALGQAGE